MIPSAFELSELLRAQGFRLYMECAHDLLGERGEEEWSLVVSAHLRMTGWVVSLRRRRVTQVLVQEIQGERVPVPNYESATIGESEPLETVEAVTAWLKSKSKKAQAA